MHRDNCVLLQGHFSIKRAIIHIKSSISNSLKLHTPCYTTIQCHTITSNWTSDEIGNKWQKSDDKKCNTVKPIAASGDSYLKC